MAAPLTVRTGACGMCVCKTSGCVWANTSLHTDFACAAYILGDCVCECVCDFKRIDDTCLANSGSLGAEVSSLSSNLCVPSMMSLRLQQTESEYLDHALTVFVRDAGRRRTFAFRSIRVPWPRSHAATSHLCRYCLVLCQSLYLQCSLEVPSLP